MLIIIFKFHITILLIQSTMNASQDKIQGILENVLEESIPLVHKGIFTT